MTAALVREKKPRRMRGVTMPEDVTIEAVIEQASSYSGRDGLTVRVVARYESAGTVGSLTMDFPQAHAPYLYVGRRVAVEVRLLD
jgi:hypothetical protein